MLKEHEQSRSFRRRLKVELELWQTEGVVSPEQAQTLTTRYDLDNLSREATTTFLHSIFLIGAVLIGLGLIAFVAAHWQAIPVPIKVVLLFSVMSASHITGYVLWKVKGTRPILGHALVLLGSLVFGANIGLMAQIFHIRSNSYNIFVVWSLGAVAMAYGLRSVPNLLLSIITSFIWFNAWTWGLDQKLLIYPFAAALICLPLSYMTKSQFSHLLAVLTIAISCGISAGKDGNTGQAVALMVTGIGVLLWAYGDFHRIKDFHQEMAAIGSVLGVLVLSGYAYVLSFHKVAEKVIDSSTNFQGLWMVYFILSVVAGFGLCIARIIGGWPKGYLGLVSTTVFVASGCLLFLSLVSVGEVAATIFANIVALALGGMMIAGGLMEFKRTLFWLGLLLVILVITSRFFEYETGLLIKSLVFIVIGVAVLYSGVLFEKHLGRRESAYV